MAEGSPNSSWHPAKMPNSPSKNQEHAEATAKIDTALQPASSDAVPTPKIPQPAHSHDLGDAWMTGDDDDEADAWLVSEDPTLQSIDVEPKEAAHSQPAEEPARSADAQILAGNAHESHNHTEHAETKPKADPFDTNEEDAGEAWFTEEAAGEPLKPELHHALEAENQEPEPGLGTAPAPARAPEHQAPMEKAAESAKEPHTAPEAAPVATRPPTSDAAEASQSPHQPPSQHSSSMSFARTVSHEISFNDDDESDWTLSRSDTDPFKFMSPSDRTNSFPAVPPARPADDPFPSHPLPSAQALDVVEEVERTTDTHEETEEQNAFWENDGAADDTDDAFKTIGGDIGDAATDASQSRFEEGLPLIPAAIESAEEQQQKPKNNAFDSFGDDDAGDDFFSQSKADESADDFIQPVQRKSTMQVIGNSLNGQPTMQQPGFDTLEEHAEEEHHSKALAEAFGGEDDDEFLPETDEPAEPAADLSAKWQEAFATGDDDDDFLADEVTNESEDVDAAGFLGSDDDGFLLYDDEDATPATAAAKAPVLPNPYLPTQTQIPSQPSSAPATSYGYASQPPQQTPYGGSFGYAPPAQPRPDAPRAESFADKAKGGYSSPYDLPTDLVTTNVKPRKRPSMPQMPQEPTPPPMAPPRSCNTYAPPPGPAASAPPAAAGAHTQPPLPRSASRQESFFEDLPITAKPRPGSRQSLRAASPSKQFGAPSPTEFAAPPVPSPLNQQYQPSSDEPDPVSNLVAPPKVNPYAALHTGSAPPPAPAGNATRYSPAPAQQAKGVSAPPPATSNRFSPIPPLARQNSSPTQTTAPASHTYLPHLPRTSSPLAQFEIHHNKAAGGDGPHLDRRASSHMEPRLNRVASLPPTREVDEEDDAQTGNQPAAPPAATARYSPGPQATAPPSQLSSPQKRSTSHYMPNAAPQQSNFAPPPRSHTQSPGAMRSNYQPARPASAHNTTAPAFGQASQTTGHMPVRTRGASLTMDMVPPTDGREHDPLQRWQGVPIFSWGIGGAMVTSFPKSTPRYTMNQTTPTMLRTPGEVRVRSMKEIEPLPDHLAKFPGPLRGKSKKKDALAWLAAGITAMEKELPDVSLSPQLSLEAKRSIERLLLWKILRVFIEFDGHLEGSPAVDKAVREVLTPRGDADASMHMDSSFGSQMAPATGMKADDVDSVSMEKIRDNLLNGDREAAAWIAVDKRLWGHAMLIAHTTSPDLYSRVAQEFVRKEVNYPGHSNQSLGAFYKVISGNFEDCVDELVPSHARAGLKLISTEAVVEPTQDAMAGLDKWRETVSLVLSNRSENDIRGLNALGKLLSGYGRAEAAQICFIFSRAVSVFGGIDDRNADFVLVGADHHKQSDQFAKETEALQLSEVYEYGLTLSGAANLAAGAPHLAGYKLQHATTLAEHGYRDKALQYCDAILTSMSAQTRRSPYHHAILEASVDDFMRRLKQAPKDDGSSWMSKPSMNKVSDSVWNRFNKFVSGDEDGNGQPGAEGEHGPFARMSSTPNISRSPSASNFETYGASPSYGVPALPQQASAANSRYAPATTPAATITQNPYEFMSQQPAQPQMNGRTSNEYTPSPYEPAYPGSGGGDSGYPGFNQQPPEMSQPGPSAYQPQVPNSSAQHYGLQPSPSINAESSMNTSYGYQGYQPAGYEPPAAEATGDMPKADQSADGGYQPPTQSYGYEAPPTQSYGYEAPSNHSHGYEPPSTGSQGYEPPSMGSQGYEPLSTESHGFEPPSTQSYGYEPPSYQPDLTNDGADDAPKPQKKSFMDDDEDDIPALKPADNKSKADLDRENAEMFKKVAEEEAKRAAEAAAAKKAGGWGFGGWFGGSKKAELGSGEASPQKAIKAKLGESNSFVYDPDLKRWINKKPGAEQTEAPKAAPPPPKGGAPRSVSGTPPPSAMGPPPGLPRSASTSNLQSGVMPPPGGLGKMPPSGLGIGVAPPMTRTDSNTSAAGPPSGPPSRPATSISNASSIDDLLGAAAPRKAGGKKPRKSGRYVDVMAK